MEQLVEAVTAKKSKQFSVLLSASPHLATQPTDEEGTTLLHVAAASSTAPIVQQLVQQGAEVNLQNGDEMTPLHVAAMWGNLPALRQLLDYGADPCVLDADDQTPLDLALNQDHTDCAKELLRTAEEEEEEEGPLPPADMSVAEAFVGMFNLTEEEEEEEEEDLTEVTQLQQLSGDEEDSSPTPTHPAMPPAPAPSNCSQDSGQNSTRRELFPDSEDEAYLDETAFLEELPHMGEAFEPAYLEETVLLDVSQKGAPPNHHAQSAGTGRVPGQPGGKMSGHEQASPDTTLNGSMLATPPPPVPREILALSDRELRERLVSLGEQPGPVTSSTRSAYQAYLARILAGVQPSGNAGYKGYKYELSLVLNGTAPVPLLDDLEQKAFQEFRSTAPLTPSSTTSSPSSASSFSSSFSLTPLRNLLSRVTTPHKSPRTPKRTKDHFNYLLLDPQVLDKLDSTSSELEQFRVFVEGVFYVGKGKNARAGQHLKDARSCDRLPANKVSSKLRRIRDIWGAGRGVVSLQVFQNISAEEAFCREACLIEAIGLDVLTNIQRGHMHGEMCSWRMGKRRLLGVHLLHKAFRSYRLSAPPELLPHDI